MQARPTTAPPKRPKKRGRTSFSVDPMTGEKTRIYGDNYKGQKV